MAIHQDNQRKIFFFFALHVGVPLETAKESINKGFKIDDWLLASGSLRYISG